MDNGISSTSTDKEEVEGFSCCLFEEYMRTIPHILYLFLKVVLLHNCVKIKLKEGE